MAVEPFSMEFEQRRFNLWIGEMIRGAEQDTVPQILRKIAFDFLRKVIKKTPVDTGRARAGWTAWLDQQGEFVNLTADAPNASVKAVSEGKQAGDFEERLGRGPIQFITLINGVHYIVFLEFGSSDQAPAGMVRLTMRELQMGGEVDKAMLEELEKTIVQADRLAFSGFIG